MSTPVPPDGFPAPPPDDATQPAADAAPPTEFLPPPPPAEFAPPPPVTDAQATEFLPPPPPAEFAPPPPPANAAPQTPPPPPSSFPPPPPTPAKITGLADAPPPPPGTPYPPQGMPYPAPGYPGGNIPRFADGKPAVDSLGRPVSPRSRLVALLLVLFIGGLGVHRFYVGKTGTGILSLVTCGGLGFWALYDLIMIILGKFTDKEERVVFNW